ncbi:MAG: hypothetical protein KJO67_14845, partial [Silicimonas sp.]|nr:hypothetical protein [Silicimonas sp.]
MKQDYFENNQDGVATLGIESLRPRQTFGLEELGLLETTPLKSIDTIVRLFNATIQVSTVS